MPSEPVSTTEALIIDSLRRRFAASDPRLAVGISDDCAVLRLDNDTALAGCALNARDWLVTTDLLVEGVHFDRRWLSLADAGYKALAVNLSDIAAMGGTAVFAFGCLAVPPETSGADVDALLDGVAQAAAESGVILAGGDTVRGPQWAVGFTVLGEAPAGEPLLRSGAQPGDVLWHTGALGLSSIGLALLCAGEAGAAEPAALNAHRQPRAQLEAGRWLREQGRVTACLDTSDSLAQCVLQLARASQTGLLLDFARYRFNPALAAFAAAHKPWRGGGPRAFNLPPRYQLDRKAARYHSLAEYLLASAEDYQLLFTTPPQVREADFAGCPAQVQRLGYVVPAEEGCFYRGEDGRTLMLGELGWQHL